MRQQVTSLESAEAAAESLTGLLTGHAEWLYSFENGRETSPIRRSECAVWVDHSRLILSCWGDAGSKIWRVLAWEWTGEKLQFDVERRLAKDSGKLEMIPRASAAAVDLTVTEARLERCLSLAKLASSHVYGSKIERAKLSPGSRPGKPGRYARIVLRDGGKRIAVTGVVAENNKGDVDSYISNALVWFLRTRETVRGPFLRSLFLVVTKLNSDAIQRRLALLGHDLRTAILLWEIDEEWKTLNILEPRDIEAFLSEKQPALRVPLRDNPSASAKGILQLSPHAIDRVRAKHGETLRFNGLPFARVRTVMERENVWFGIDRSQRKRLAPDTEREWDTLYADLALGRNAIQPDKRNALYRALPEAWLESILRRDITKLDPGLIIAPIHAQFRTNQAQRAGSRPIDLLALREDGRLAVIELKVAEDLVLTLQGAEYWLRVEAHRRQGNITRSRLFADREIADEPPLVYLVGPTLRFHRAFSTLAKCIRTEIEIYRFDINEDWRGGVRVMRRMRVN